MDPELVTRDRSTGAAADTVLEVRGLTTHILTRAGRLPAVSALSFVVRPGEMLGIVGESGCGKSMTALSIMRLLPAAAHVVAGAVLFRREDLLRLDERRMQEVRGKAISMIFQEPMSSLNPSMTIGRQVSEVVLRHERASRREALERAVEMLRLVSIPDPARRARDYPHQLSGGMRQRAMIAIALACDPALLIADEPTTALDVTIQAQILHLIRDLQARLGTAVVLITHDLGVIAETVQRVVVMYAGRKVEEASVDELFERPLHPYTRGLLAAVPKLGAASAGAGRQRLQEIAGLVPALDDLPPGCPFAPRCPRATDHCRALDPPLEEKRPKHWAACWEVSSAHA